MPRRLSIAALALFSTAAAVAAAHADPLTPTPKPFSRDDARAIIRDAQRILPPNGIEEMRQVELGGVPEWISVRGRDKRNPILLFIHGGPASTEMPTSWLYRSAWEDFFTVVQWDQRGAGKTAATTNNPAIMPSVTVERMTQDGEELVAWLRAHYRKRKIIVMGHSWGTVIGMNLAIRHPDWLHAYVGMGQIIDWSDNERVGYDFALREAEKDHNAQALADLKSIAPYPPSGRPETLKEIIKQRTWVIHYGGLTSHRKDFDFDENVRKISPDYTDRDLSPPGFKDGEALERLLPGLSQVDFRKVTQLRTPVFIFAGRRDYETPSQVAAAWYARVKAPKKGLFWFDQSAHMMQLEQPGKVLMHLVNDVRPIAAKAGDVAPPDRTGVD